MARALGRRAMLPSAGSAHRGLGLLGGPARRGSGQKLRGPWAAPQGHGSLSHVCEQQVKDTGTGCPQGEPCVRITAGTWVLVQRRRWCVKARDGPGPGREGPSGPEPAPRPSSPPLSGPARPAEGSWCPEPLREARGCCSPKAPPASAPDPAGLPPARPPSAAPMVASPIPGGLLSSMPCLGQAHRGRQCVPEPGGGPQRSLGRVTSVSPFAEPCDTLTCVDVNRALTAPGPRLRWTQSCSPTRDGAVHGPGFPTDSCPPSCRR